MTLPTLLTMTLPELPPLPTPLRRPADMEDIPFQEVGGKSIRANSPFPFKRSLNGSAYGAMVTHKASHRLRELPSDGEPDEELVFDARQSSQQSTVSVPAGNQLDDREQALLRNGQSSYHWCPNGVRTDGENTLR